MAAGATTITNIAITMPAQTAGLGEAWERGLGMNSASGLGAIEMWSSRDSTLQKLPPLSCRSFDDLKSQVGGFPLEIVDLQLAVLSVVELRSFVHELHPVAQHAVDQSSQFGRHSLNRNRSPEPGSQSAKLRSQIRIA